MVDFSFMIKFVGFFIFVGFIMLTFGAYWAMKEKRRFKIIENLSDPKKSLSYFVGELRSSICVLFFCFLIFIILSSIYPLLFYISTDKYLWMELVFYAMLDLCGLMPYVFVNINTFKSSIDFTSKYHNLKVDFTGSIMYNLYKIIFISPTTGILLLTLAPFLYSVINIKITIYVIMNIVPLSIIEIQYLFSLCGMLCAPGIFLVAYIEYSLQKSAGLVGYE